MSRHIAVPPLNKGLFERGMHSRVKDIENKETTKRRFKLTTVLTSIILVSKVVGVYLTNSLALLSDSAHVFMDLFALSTSLLVIYLFEMPPTETKTFGWHRVEVFASFINSFLLTIMAAVIFYKAYFRLPTPPSVKGVKA